MKNQRAGIGTGVAVFVVVVLLAFAACLAIADDNDNDSMAPLKSRRDNGHDDGGHNRESGRDSRGKCENASYCDDRDFSPRADKIIVCLPNSRCDFGAGEQASLVPPNPEKLVGAISAMTKGIGDAAGALAGAIAGGTIGILL